MDSGKIKTEETRARAGVAKQLGKLKARLRWLEHVERKTE